MNLEVKPVVIIAVLLFAAWLIGQPPRRPRAGVTPAPKDAPEPSAQQLETPRNGTRVRAWDTPIVEN